MPVVPSAADEPAEAADGGVAELTPRGSPWRAVAAGALAVVAIVLAAIAISSKWTAFESALRAMDGATLVVSFLGGLGATAATYPSWRAVLEGLNVDLPWLAGARVFFVSQLGKYVPGSVWPVVLQMEAGQAHGAKRRTMLAGNLLTLTINLAVGLLVACVLLPIYDGAALHRYWWVLLAVPVLLALLHPRAMPGILDWGFARVGRAPLGERLSSRALVEGSAWSLVSWASFGVQVGVLANAVAHRGLSTYLLCAGAMALAVCAGVLFLPAPAGAGIRDVVLVLVLSILMKPGQAFGVVVIVRVSLILVDLCLAGLGALIGRNRR